MGPTIIDDEAPPAIELGPALNPAGCRKLPPANADWIAQRGVRLCVGEACELPRMVMGQVTGRVTSNFMMIAF